MHKMPNLKLILEENIKKVGVCQSVYVVVEKFMLSPPHAHLFFITLAVSLPINDLHLRRHNFYLEQILVAKLQISMQDAICHQLLYFLHAKAICLQAHCLISELKLLPGRFHLGQSVFIPDESPAVWAVINKTYRHAVHRRAALKLDFKTPIQKPQKSKKNLNLAQHPEVSGVTY